MNSFGLGELKLALQGCYGLYNHGRIGFWTLKSIMVPLYQLLMLSGSATVHGYSDD
jgi:hypothetical protein